MSKKLVVGVTGATGFLGQALCQGLVAQGHDVVAFSRQPHAALGQLRWSRFCLPEKLDPAAFEGLDVIIHCAYETRFSRLDRAREVNIEGFENLQSACRAASVGKFVFISSMSAHEDAESFYGRSKFELEQRLKLSQSLVIRPGFIVGFGGIFDRLRATLAKFPLVPLFFGGRQRIQTVWIDDLVQGILSAIEFDLSGVLNIAETEPVAIRDFYRGMASLAGRRPVFVSLPGGVFARVLSAFEAWGVRLPLSSENLKGLKKMRTFDVSSDLSKVGLSPRSFPESLATWKRLNEDRERSEIR